MHGGPSHVATFDPEPLLAALDGKPVPPSFGKANFQFTRMDTVPLTASQRVFKKRGQSGIEISDLFEHTAHFADDLAVVRSFYHDGFSDRTDLDEQRLGPWGNHGRGAREYPQPPS